MNKVVINYSDARILIHDVTLPVHRSVICVQSAYFEKTFQESFVEGSSGVLIFNDGSEAAHWRVLGHLYTGDYSDDLRNNFEGRLPLTGTTLGFLIATKLTLNH